MTSNSLQTHPNEQEWCLLVADLFKMDIQEAGPRLFMNRQDVVKQSPTSGSKIGSLGADRPFIRVNVCADRGLRGSIGLRWTVNPTALWTFYC